jgi:hypothetical protein
MDSVGLRGQGETQCYGSFFEDAFSRSASLFYTLHPKSPYFCGHLPSYVSCTSEFLPFLALQVVVLLSFSGSTERPSMIGVPSTDRIIHLLVPTMSPSLRILSLPPLGYGTSVSMSS